jgi:cobalt-zinc-cadmium efflux system membrane fusion protein
MLNEIDLTEQGETISHYSIRAPFSGTVVSKDVVLREQVRPDDMLFSIADLSTVWVTTDIYEEHVPLLETLAGQKVTIRVAVYPEQTFEADVFYTGEIMDEATRTIAMRAIANNPNRMLKPGMFVTVEFPVHNESDALQIPLSAIQEHEGQKFVFVHDDGGRFERRNIQVGETNQDSLIVLDGLQLGESVVTKGGFILKSRLLASLLGEE